MSNDPVYDDQFYADIIKKRRELGNTQGYVNLDECQRSKDQSLKKITTDDEIEAVSEKLTVQQ